MARNFKKTKDLSWHLLFLSRIYSFTGWLGLLGGLFLLISTQTTGPEATPIMGMSAPVGGFILICWSVVLLNFSRDIWGQQRWSTGIAGYIIGFFQLFSVPIGTAIGSYTLWILLKNRQISTD